MSREDQDNTSDEGEDKIEKPPNLLKLRVSPDASRPQLARAYKVNRSTICRWEHQGVDIWNPREVKIHIDTLVVKPPIYRIPAKGLTYEEARIKKLSLESERLERQLDREEGNWAHNDVIKEDGLQAASKLKAGMLKLEVELPPMLVGLTEAEMQKIIRDATDSLLKSFTNSQEELFIGYDR